MCTCTFIEHIEEDVCDQEAMSTTSEMRDREEKK